MPKRSTKVTILWKTGATTETLVPRPDSTEAATTPAGTVAAIRELAAQRMTDEEVSAALNLCGLQPARACRFTKTGVAILRANHKIPPGQKTGRGKPAPAQDALGRYSIRGLVARYGVSEGTARYWAEKGILHAQEGSKGFPRWFVIDGEVEAKNLGADAALSFPDEPSTGTKSRLAGAIPWQALENQPTTDVGKRRDSDGTIGRVSTNWRMGTAGRTWSTRLAAPSDMRLPRQLGHTARALHEKATTWCTPHDSQ